MAKGLKRIISYHDFTREEQYCSGITRIKIVFELLKQYINWSSFGVSFARKPKIH
jgi:hypothetical protein